MRNIISWKSELICFLVYAPIVVALYMAFKSGVDLSWVWEVRSWQGLWLILPGAAVAWIVKYLLIARPTGTHPGEVFTSRTDWIIFVIAVTVVPFSEEYMFRLGLNILLTGLLMMIMPPASALLISLILAMFIFGALHALRGGWQLAIITTVYGFLWTVAALTGGLIVSMIAHAGTNLLVTIMDVVEHRLTAGPT